MNKITLVCQNCNGTLEVGAEQNVLCCHYCGQKTLVAESDEVKIARMQTNTEKETTFSKNRTKVAIGAMIALVLIVLMIIFKNNEVVFYGLICLGLFVVIFSPNIISNRQQKIALQERAKRKKPIANGIRLPISYDDAILKEYHQIVDILNDAGFTNVQTLQTQRSLVKSMFENSEFEVTVNKLLEEMETGGIAEITVNGSTDFEAGDYYLPDAYIVITYLD